MSDRESEAATVARRRTPSQSMRAARFSENAPTLPAEADTGVATRLRNRSARSSLGPPLADLTTDLSSRTLVRDEMLRSRSLGRVGATLSILIGAVVPFLGGTVLSTALVLGACAISAIANAWLIYLCGDPERFRPGPLAVIWLSAAIAVGGGVSFFGVFSPAPLAAGLGVYFVALGNSRWLAYAVWIVIAVVMGAVATLTIAGVFDDPGLITADSLPVGHRILLLVLLEGLLLGVFILGRHSRAGTAAAVAELERATRALALREALLDEARVELQAVLAAGGAGPWSGRELDGYLIGKLLGRGGMGEVYEALGPGDKPVAIKLLTPASALDGMIVERFRREAEVTAALSSANIVKVFAVSPANVSVPYLIMERLSGRDLAELLRKHGRLAHPALIDMVNQIAAGLDCAHAAGVVHRDIKPQNLFADESGGRRVWKILDFGVSKLAEHGGTLTGGNVVGTPSYMAPEQAQGLPDVGPSADAYALAAISYRALTGRPPFRGKTTAALLYNVVHRTPIRPSSLVRLPSAVDAVLALGMAKDPARRIETATEFAKNFADALSDSLDPAVATRARRLQEDEPWSES